MAYALGQWGYSNLSSQASMVPEANFQPFLDWQSRSWSYKASTNAFNAISKGTRRWASRLFTQYSRMRVITPLCYVRNLTQPQSFHNVAQPLATLSRRSCSTERRQGSSGRATGTWSIDLIQYFAERSKQHNILLPQLSTVMSRASSEFVSLRRR